MGHEKVTDGKLTVKERYAHSGEGASLDQAELRQYQDGLFLRWDTPGQVVELAPIPDEDGPYDWRTAEGYYMTVPDIFNVHDGDRESIIGMTTQTGVEVVIKDGKLYHQSRVTGKKGVFDMDEYFTDKHPVIGEDWQMFRRDDGKPLILPGIQEIQLEATRRLEMHAGYDDMKRQQRFSESTGNSALKQTAGRLIAFLERS